MQFSIRGQQIEVTDALRDYVDKKLSRLEKYFDAPPTSEGYVTLGVVRGLHTVEVTIPLAGVTLRAEDRSDDMYASIDAVVDKLERQIRKHKTKLNRKFRQEGSLKTLFVEGNRLMPCSCRGAGQWIMMIWRLCATSASP
jgi:putative sigma-54 modulation protein